MAAMGLLEEVYRLPMVPPRDGLARAGSDRCSASSKTDAALLVGTVVR